MKLSWFKKTGLIYYAVSVAGFLLSAVVAIYCITVFMAVDKNSHSVSDTLYGIFPHTVSALTILFWIAAHTIVHLKE